jgi:hypothetical protein
MRDNAEQTCGKSITNARKPQTNKTASHINPGYRRDTEAIWTVTFAPHWRFDLEVDPVNRDRKDMARVGEERGHLLTCWCGLLHLHKVMSWSLSGEDISYLESWREHGMRTYPYTKCLCHSIRLLLAEIDFGAFLRMKPQ